jgi:hypothetical protein
MSFHHTVQRAALAAGLMTGASAALLVPAASAKPNRPHHHKYQPALQYTYVNFPRNNSIRSNLINTFPLGKFAPLGVPFTIDRTPKTCGSHGTGACNFFDAFGSNGNGLGIVMNVSLPRVSHVYTLMNAYTPPPGAQVATIEFVGSLGTTQTFPLIAGEDIRDFFQYTFANTLNNGVPGVNAQNTFSCSDPTNCLGAGVTGRVSTGYQGTYVVDQQDFALNEAFLNQTLVQIVITDTYNGATPILLGITAGS